MDNYQDLDRSFEKFSGFTNVHVLKISYEWKIHNFRVIGLRNGDEVESPEFLSNYGNIKWSLLLFPKGRDEDCANFLTLFLQLESNPEKLQLETYFEFSIFDTNKKKMFCKKAFIYFY